MSEPQYLSTDPHAGQAVPPPPAAPPADPSAARSRGWQPAGSFETGETPAPASNLEQMLGPLAHPETLTDFARLLTLPVDSVRKAAISALSAAAARPAASTALTATGRGVERAGAALEAPAKMATAYEMVTDPKRAVLTFAAPKVVQGAGRLMQRAGTALATPAAEASTAAPAVAEAPPIVQTAARATPDEVLRASQAAPTNALPDQKLLNELAIQARRVGVTLTPQMEQVAIQAVGKGATPSQAVRGFAPSAPTEAAPVAVKPKLLASEAPEYKRLLTAGKTHKEAMDLIAMERELQQRLGLSTPTAAEKRFPKGMRGKTEGD